MTNTAKIISELESEFIELCEILHFESSTEKENSLSKLPDNDLTATNSVDGSSGCKKNPLPAIEK